MIATLPAARSGRSNVPEGCPLTRRECELLFLVAQGLTYKQIGAQLHIAESTVRATMHTASRRLGVPSAVQAVIHCVKEDWFRIEPDGTLSLAEAPVDRRRRQPVTEIHRLYLETFDRWLRTPNDTDREELRVLLRIMRRHGQTAA